MAVARGLAICAVCVALLVSANVLALLGIPYVAEGGSLVLKIHPASMLCYLASVAQCMSSKRNCLRLPKAQPWLAGFLFSVAICLSFEATMTGASNLIVLLDTYLPAGLLASVMYDAPVDARYRLRRAMQVCFAGNALLALMEGASHCTLVPLAPDSPASLLNAADFRPTALYDHPLTGAAMTVIATFVSPDRRHGPWLHGSYLVLMGLGLVAFGGRAAITASLLIVAWLGAGSARRAVLTRRVPMQSVVAFPLALCIGAAACLAIYGSGLGGRLGRHFYWDASAQVRLDQWNVLGLLNLQQLLFGAARKDLLALLEPLRVAYGVPVIENFWLLMFLSLGVLGFPFFLAGLASLLCWCARRGNGRGLLMVMAITAIASTSNSLGRKSSLLLILVAAASSMPAAASSRKPVLQRGGALQDRSRQAPMSLAGL
jgi:hypothetical protein